MSDQDAGTAPEEPEAQPETGTPSNLDEVTTLKSRAAGLDAKVSKLLEQVKAAEEARQKAEQSLADLQTGKVQADEALSARLAEKDAEIASIRREAKLTAAAAKYPETFGVLGESIATMSDDQLAAAEARFKGVPETTSQAPVGNNAARSQAPTTKAIGDMNVKELEEHLRTFDPSVVLGSR
jgi:hypothetical protein